MTQYSLIENLGNAGAIRTIINDNVKASFKRVFNVEVYGAKHDTQTASDASVNSSSATLSTVADRFFSTDTGKKIRVYGAGVAGVDLITTITYVNTKTVTLGTNASTTIAAKKIKWGTDDTQAIQDAATAATVLGCDVTLPNGRYYIGGPLITSVNGVNPNCQIYVPLRNTTDNMPMIKFIGESVLILPRGPFVSQIEPTSGVILDSNIDGTGTLPSVIGSSFEFNGLTNSNLTIPHFENIAILVKSMHGTTHDAPTMTHFKLNNCESKQLKNCLAFIESNPSESVLPTAAQYGYYLSEQGHTDVHSMYENITAIGCQTGFRTEEHDYWTKMNAYCCEYAAEVNGNTSGHPIMGNGTITNNWCKYGIKFVSGKTVDLDYYAERWPGPFTSRWFDGVADFVFPTSVVMTGALKGAVTLAGGGDASVIVQGTYTGNLKITDMRALTSATATLNFDLTAVNYQDLTITLTGALVGEPVVVSPPATMVADVTYFAWVSATNTVTVRCSRVDGAVTPNPASGTFLVRLIR